MVADAANRLLTVLQPKLRASLRAGTLPLVMLVSTLLMYAIARQALARVVVTTSMNCVALQTATIALAVMLSGTTYIRVPVTLRILTRGIGAVVLAQVGFDVLSLFYAPPQLVAGAPAWFLWGGGFVAIAAGAAGMLRPAFLLPLIVYYVAFRHQFNILSGVEISETDYLSMLDIGLFATIGALLVANTAQTMHAHRAADSAKESEKTAITAAGLIWACAVGAHLGNYLVSGWTKVQAGSGDPFFWLLHNPTQTSILMGLERGDNPLALWPSLVQWSWDSIVAGGIVLNAIVLGMQLAAPLALAHRRVLMLFTLMYDAFHIGVYFTLGALFHFWIAVNVIIFLSARRMSDRAFTPAMKAVGLGAILLGHFIFYTSHLGWLDGPKLASPSFSAETADGRSVPVPGVYFGMLSYSIAQTALYVPDGHFPQRLGGNSYNVADWRDAQTCGPDVRERQDTGVPLSTVYAWVQGTDAAMRNHPIVKNANLYYAYPHHMMANPALFADFNRLRIEDIVRYRYTVDSVCLSLRDGKLQRDVKKSTDYVINVRR